MHTNCQPCLASSNPVTGWLRCSACSAPSGARCRRLAVAAPGRGPLQATRGSGPRQGAPRGPAGGASSFFSASRSGFGAARAARWRAQRVQGAWSAPLGAVFRPSLACPVTGDARGLHQCKRAEEEAEAEREQLAAREKAERRQREAAEAAEASAARQEQQRRRRHRARPPQPRSRPSPRRKRRICAWPTRSADGLSVSVSTQRRRRRRSGSGLQRGRRRSGGSGRLRKKSDARVLRQRARAAGC